MMSNLETRSKHAMVIVVDVSKSMCKRDNGKSHLDEAARIITRLIQQRLWEARKSDKIGIITFGSDETNNSMYEEGDDQYKGINVRFPLASASLDMMKFADQGLEQGNANPDILEALFIGTSHLMQETSSKSASAAGKPLKFDRELVLITDGEGFTSQDGADVLSEQLIADKIFLTVIAMGFDDKDKSEQKKDNEDFCKQLVDYVQGSLTTGQVALENVESFQKKQVSPVPVYNGSLTLGELELNVKCFNKTSELKTPSAKKIAAAVDGIVRVEKTHSRIRGVEDGELAGQEVLVEEQDLVRAHRYGRSLVQMTPADEEALKMHTEKAMEIMGFVSRHEVGRHLFLNNSSLVRPFNEKQYVDPKASLALAALARALQETERYALCRWIAQDDRSLKMGVLIPQVTQNKQVLYFCQLPFAEDVRDYQFDSLEEVTKEPEERLTKKRHRFNHRKIPRTEAEANMDAWIKKMDLMNVWNQEEDVRDWEAFQPKKIYSPAYHATYEAVGFKALHPNDPIPSMDKIMKQLDPIPKVVQGARQELQRLKSSFSLTKPNKSKYMQEEEVELPQVPIAIEFNLTDPIGDFQALTSRGEVDLIHVACKRLQDAILKLVRHYFGPLSTSGSVAMDKVMTCLKLLRETSARESETSFKPFMMELKKFLHSEPSYRPVWEKMKSLGLGLIDENVEVHHGEYASARELEVYWKDVGNDEVEVEDVVQLYDDDLDDME